jgi:hypothetical protein
MAIPTAAAVAVVVVVVVVIVLVIVVRVMKARRWLRCPRGYSVAVDVSC